MADGILEKLGRALSFLGVSDPAELRRKEERRRVQREAAAKVKAAGSPGAAAETRQAADAERDLPGDSRGDSPDR